MSTLDPQVFFSTDYTGFSSYDNIRKISNAIDGHKNASRKILHFTMGNRLDTFTKVSNLSSRIQDATSYLHGSLEGTVVNNAQDFVGTNNIPMLLGDGTFGTRFIPEAAASRYIFAKFNPVYSQFFNRDDFPILDHQVFEGDEIEPKFYVPNIPLVLLNGATGISVGYSQKILPRRLDDIIKAVHLRIRGETPGRLVPYFEGFRGTITPTDQPNQWTVSGVFERQTKTQIIITELPIGYDLKGYIDVLEKLEESGKIRGYADESENDQFRFVVAVSREDGAKDDSFLMGLLKLSKNVSENFTAIDTENRVREFRDEIDILDYWLKVRLEYNERRKVSLTEKLESLLHDLQMRKAFISAVIDRTITLERRSTQNIMDQILGLNPELHEYMESNNLLNIPISSITEERITELDDRIKKTTESLQTLLSTTVVEMLQSDIKSINIPKTR